MELTEVMSELKLLEDEKIRAVNLRRGDDHAVNLTKLRALAKELTQQPKLAMELWRTGDTAARLLALLISRPKDYSREQLDTMLREAHAPKVQDWLINYIVQKSKHAEELRVAWFTDPDPRITAGAWALTFTRIAKSPEGLDLSGLLDIIETEMKDAPEKLQWQMNNCLANIGIHHPDLRARALAIGENLEVLKDYPTPPNCTSPCSHATASCRATSNWLSRTVSGV